MGDAPAMDLVENRLELREKPVVDVLALRKRVALDPFVGDGCCHCVASHADVAKRQWRAFDAGEAVHEPSLAGGEGSAQPSHRHEADSLCAVELAFCGAGGRPVDGRRGPRVVLEDLDAAKRLAVERDRGRRVGGAEGPEGGRPWAGGGMAASRNVGTHHRTIRHRSAPASRGSVTTTRGMAIDRGGGTA